MNDWMNEATTKGMDENDRADERTRDRMEEWTGRRMQT